MKTKQPNRRVTIEIKIGADTIEDFIGTLNHLIFGFKSDKLSENDYQAVGGGYGANYTVNIAVDPDMDHGKYFEIMDKILEENLAISEVLRLAKEWAVEKGFVEVEAVEYVEHIDAWVTRHTDRQHSRKIGGTLEDAEQFLIAELHKRG